MADTNQIRFSCALVFAVWMSSFVADSVCSAGDRASTLVNPQPVEPTPDPLSEINRPLAAVSLRSALHPEVQGARKLRLPADQARVTPALGEPILPRVLLPDTGQAYPFCHNPLYFEDPNLERCGRGHGLLTEGVSFVRFFGRAPLLPYMTGSCEPCRLVRSPQSCSACHHFGCDAYLPPLNAIGVAAQAAATVSLIAIIP